MGRQARVEIVGVNLHGRPHWRPHYRRTPGSRPEHFRAHHVFAEFIESLRRCDNLPEVLVILGLAEVVGVTERHRKQVTSEINARRQIFCLRKKALRRDVLSRGLRAPAHVTS